MCFYISRRGLVVRRWTNIQYLDAMKEISAAGSYLLNNEQNKTYSSPGSQFVKRNYKFDQAKLKFEQCKCLQIYVLLNEMDLI